ncbi:hypothetical protein BKI52_25275 [marine bacterium AO1-C]|nr:hypothetical protein BKI52_25275 [marine bacterium AO1-C]
MIQKKIITCSIIIYLLSLPFLHLSAQNQQYSQFHQSPLLVNPAWVAANNQMTVLINYRREMLGGNESFSNPMLSFIRPFVNKAKKEDGSTGQGKRWGGAGVHIIQDQTLGNSLQTIGFGVTYAHNVKLAKHHFISFGGQVGYLRKSLNPDALQSEQDLLGQPTVDPLLSGGIRTKGVVSFNTGVLWYQSGDFGQHRSFFGVAAYHLNQPDFEFIGSADAVTQPIHFIINGGIEVLNTDKFSLQPNFRWILENQLVQLNVGALGRYRLQPNHMLGMGAWWSQGLVIVGLDYTFKNLFVGVSYDIAVSQENKRTATEITVGYRKTLGKQ